METKEKEIIKKTINILWEKHNVLCDIKNKTIKQEKDFLINTKVIEYLENLENKKIDGDI